MKRSASHSSRIKLAALATMIIMAGAYWSLNHPGQQTHGTAVSAVPVTEGGQELTIITTESYHTYFEHENNGADGMGFQLVREYAEENDFSLNIILAPHSDDIYQALDSGLADIGLIGKPLSISRQAYYPQSQSYMNTTTQLVYRHGSGTPRSFEELADKNIVVPDNEQYREKYAFIKQHYPDVEWQFSDHSIEELLGMVNTGTIDHTVLDSHQYIKLRALYTRTRVAFDIYYPEPVTLALAQDQEEELNRTLHSYLDRIKADGSLSQMIERYYGHTSDSNPRGSMAFFHRVNVRLPHYQDLIEQIATEYNIDWRLLAAISYQESHWNPHARSHTGVRGMMMLTLNTAREVGVNNRLDTEQSLHGGAHYFKRMLARLPQSIEEPDRTWFALAAYNVGLGHIFDAREITEFQGGDPDRWADVKDRLPLLEREEWYQYTRYGRARGSEPVQYVQNIRHFNDLLAWRFPSDGELSNTPQTQLAIKPLDEALQQAKADKTDPSKGPVRLSALMSETQSQ